MSAAGVARTLRRRLLAGLVVIAPVGITLFVLWWIFERLDQVLGRFLYPALGLQIPGLGLIALLALLLLVGWATERAVGSRIIAYWHALLERAPLTRRIFVASNRIVRSVFGEQRRLFRAVVLVEYPAPGRWAIGFLAGDSPAPLGDGEDGVAVFVPTTPNPTSGWIVLMPRDQLVFLDMTIEEAFTYILSAGTVLPEPNGGTASPAADLLERAP